MRSPYGGTLACAAGTPASRAGSSRDDGRSTPGVRHRRRGRGTACARRTAAHRRHAARGRRWSNASWALVHRRRDGIRGGPPTLLPALRAGAEELDARLGADLLNWDMTTFVIV